MKKVQIAERTQGHMGQNEDWWHLVQEDDGSTYVLHSWNHVKVNGLTVNDGEERIATADYFSLSGEALNAKLKALLS